MIPAPTPLSSSDLLNGEALRELILLAGKDGVGKSCAIVSMAWYIEQTNPDAKFFVIDTENKFTSAMRSFKSDAPKNIVYYKCTNMNEVNAAVAAVIAKHKLGDWLAVESMGPVWDMAQDLATMAIAGVSRVEYMEAKKGTKFANGVEKKGSPIPSPDEYWKIAKGSYDGAFLDPIRMSDTLNTVMSSIAKPVKDQRPGQKENQDRKAFRVEVGMDANLAGSPTMPSIVETLCLLELNNGKVNARVLRDNLSVLDDSRVEFEVPGRKDFGMTFFSTCR
jgi:hypothetical protein